MPKRDYSERKSSAQTYLIHDFGQRPFKVVIYRDTVTVYKIPSSTPKSPIVSQKKQQKKLYTEKILQFQYLDKIFIGRHSGTNTVVPANFKKFSDGNTVLCCTTEVANFLNNTIKFTYVCIGPEIVSFTTTEPITHYYSRLHIPDLPFPVALSENYVYLPFVNVVAPRILFPSTIDWATETYDVYFGEKMKAEQQMYDKYSKDLRDYTVLVHRLYNFET